MSRMECKCGATMGTSTAPSPYGLSIFYDWEIQAAITENPKIFLSDFLTGWDDVNEEERNYMKRLEPVEYWYCTECQRVYEVQAKACGYSLRTYQRICPSSLDTQYENWEHFYVLKETETDAALEEFPQILLIDFLKKYMKYNYLLSSDERIAIALSIDNQTMQFAYILEERPIE